MGIHEIILPETKPALEWLGGRAVQKLTPRRRHAMTQIRFGATLSTWSTAHCPGEVGSEWECRLAPPGEIRRPLVPDVLFISYDRVPLAELQQDDYLRVGPDVVVEILSPGDKQRYLEEKVRVYLACGTKVIFIVDTTRKVVTARDGGETKVFASNAILTHPSTPGFALSLEQLFKGM